MNSTLFFRSLDNVRPNVKKTTYTHSLIRDKTKLRETCQKNNRLKEIEHRNWNYYFLLNSIKSNLLFYSQVFYIVNKHRVKRKKQLIHKTDDNKSQREHAVFITHTTHTHTQSFFTEEETKSLSIDIEKFFLVGKSFATHYMRSRRNNVSTAKKRKKQKKVNVF